MPLDLYAFNAIFKDHYFPRIRAFMAGDDDAMAEFADQDRERWQRAAEERVLDGRPLPWLSPMDAMLDAMHEDDWF